MMLEDMTEGYIDPVFCTGCMYAKKRSTLCDRCKRNGKGTTDFYLQYAATLKEQFYDVNDPKSDPVNKPKHYLFGGLELLEIIDALLDDGGFSPKEAFYVMTILQYIIRAPKKNGVQDYRKAQYYLNRLLEGGGK